MEAVLLTYFLKCILEIPNLLAILIIAFILERVVQAGTRPEQAFTIVCV